VAALIASLTLPGGHLQWWSVAPTGRSVLVTGSPTTGPLCEFYVVDLGTLSGRGPYRRACDKPPGSAHRVIPTVRYSRSGPYDSVTVAGKVAMRYEDASNTRPQYAWSGTSLWIYDVATTKGAEVLRLDADTGEVLQRTVMPKLFRPVMVANRDGLWLDPATNGGVDGVSVAPLLHVAVGAAKPVVVHRGGRAAMWMVASPHTVWLEQIAGRSSVSIWRIDHSKAQLLARPRKIGYVAAYGSGRLWELTCGATEHLVRVAPNTGALTQVQHVPRDGNLCDDTMTATGGRVVVLAGRKLYVYPS
jgi:hypothetical protein